MGLLIRKDLIQSTEQMKGGWTLLKLVKVEEKVAGDKDFTNISLTFEGMAGPENEETNVGRSHRHMISGKAVNMNVAIVAERLLQLVQALTGEMDRNALEGVEVEFRDYIGKQVWGNIQPELNKTDNKTYPTLIGFTPENVTPF